MERTKKSNRKKGKQRKNSPKKKCSSAEYWVVTFILISVMRSANLSHFSLAPGNNHKQKGENVPNWEKREKMVL
jgi:hypothetical protein